MCKSFAHTWTFCIEVCFTNPSLCYTFLVSQCDIYRVVFLTGPPDFQYQNEKQVAATQD